MSTDATTQAGKSWTTAEVRTLIREIITELAPSVSNPAPEARLIEDLGFHSLSLLELAFSLEDEFHLATIDEATARTIVTLDDVERYVLRELHLAETTDAA
jgi:acyl carrier protein